MIIKGKEIISCDYIRFLYVPKGAVIEIYYDYRQNKQFRYINGQFSDIGFLSIYQWNNWYDSNRSDIRKFQNVVKEKRELPYDHQA